MSESKVIIREIQKLSELIEGKKYSLAGKNWFNIKEMMNFSSMQIMENYFEKSKNQPEIDADAKLIYMQKMG